MSQGGVVGVRAEIKERGQLGEGFVRVGLCVGVCLSVGVVEKFESNRYIAIYLSKHHPHDCMHGLP